MKPLTIVVVGAVGVVGLLLWRRLRGGTPGEDELGLTSSTAPASSSSGTFNPDVRAGSREAFESLRRFALGEGALPGRV